MKEHPSKHIRAYFNDTNCLKASCFYVAYISQNIYLYATLHGMKSITRASSRDEKTLKELLGLDDNYHLILAQSVGY